jgi:hypothetical protein
MALSRPMRSTALDLRAAGVVEAGAQRPHASALSHAELNTLLRSGRAFQPLRQDACAPIDVLIHPAVLAGVKITEVATFPPRP